MYRKIIISTLPFMLWSNVFAEEIASTRLNDTVISTKGFSTTTQEENKNVVVLNNEDIQNNGFSTLDSVLASSPFITVKAGEKGSDRQIDLRGQGKNSASKVKIMVDSVPLNILDTSHAQLPLDSINVSQIDKVEIIPGNGSVLYGNNATGGTVNIITKADSQKEYGYVQELYKSYHTNDVSLGIGRFINNKLYLNFDYSNLDTKGYRVGDENKAHFVSGGFSYNLTDNQRLSFNVKYSQNDGITSNGISKEKIEENRRQSGDFISDYLDKSINYALKYDYKINDNIELNAKAYYQELTTDLDSRGKIVIQEGSEYDILSGQAFTGSSWDGDWIGNFKETKTGTNLKTKINYSSGNVVVGYDYLTNKLSRDNKIDLDVVNTPAMQMTYTLNADNIFKKDTHSAFVLLDQKIVNDLKFNAGYRYEVAYFDSNRNAEVQHSSNRPIPPLDTYQEFDGKTHDNNMAYSAGLSYDFNSLNKVYVNYERGYVSPSPTQLINKDITAGYYYNDLKSQTGDNIDIGYKGYALGSYISLSTFYSQNNNEIVMKGAGLVSGGDIHSEWSYENIDKTRRSGFEAFAEQSISKLTFNESLSYINTRVLEGSYKGQRVAVVPDWKVVVNAKYEVINKFNVGARVNYTGKYLENNNDDTSNLSYAPSVITADLLVNYSPIDKLYVLAGINNVFNEKYNISQDTFGNYVVAPERNYYMGLKYEF